MIAVQSTRARIWRRQRTRQELRTGPMYELRFDGKKLGLIENGSEMASWHAVSGMPGYQGQQHEIWEGRGPVPGGRYKMNVDRIQKISVGDRFAGVVGRGGWPGG